MNGTLSGNQHVTFAFPQSPDIYYQRNKGHIGPFYLLKMYMTKHFFYGKLFTFEQLENTHAMKDRLGGVGSKFLPANGC